HRPAPATPPPSAVSLPPSIAPYPPLPSYPTRRSSDLFPFASFTITDGGELTAVPAVADWLVGLFAAIVAAVPAVPVAVNVTGLPLKPVEVAVSVFGPAVALSVQLPTVIGRAAVCISVTVRTRMPPSATANVTATCATG